MLERIMEMDTYVYVLWGVGVLGLLLKMMANTYLKSLIKASENMATTKKKKLQIIARKYKNRQSLGMNNCNGDAFVEKNIRRIKFAAMPFEFWRKCGNTLAFVVVAITAGSFLYYDVSWRGSPDMIALMANSVCVCAFLFALENIFLINNKVEILKANIKDYIENVTPVRETVKLRSSIRADPSDKLSEQEAAVTKTDGVKKDCTSPEMVNHIQEEVKRKQLEKEEKSDGVRASPKNDVMIDSFLREFFS